MKNTTDSLERLSAPAGSPSGVELAVCGDIANRQKVGIRKYGTTVANNPLSLREWLQHAYEDCLYQAVYLKRAMSELPPLPKTCRQCGGYGSEEIQSGPYFRQCSACLGTGKESASDQATASK